MAFGGVWRFHHVGLACREIDAERRAWEAAGYRAEGPKITDPIQKVTVQFLLGEGPRLELIEPAGAPSPIDRLLERGVKMYHLAWETSDLPARIAELEGRGYRALAAPVPAVAFGGRPIVFLLSEALGLIELIAEG